MKKYAVILAGGAGLRAGGEVPKQFQMLCGLPVLWWSVKAFHDENPDTIIRIALHPGFFDLWDILFSELPPEERKIDYNIVCGGRNRIESVKNVLLSIEDEEEALVAVHDAARPLITPAIISRGWEMARNLSACVPAVPMVDSMRKLSPVGSEAVDRAEFVRVQTPQVFDLQLLKRAYGILGDDAPSRLTDDASVVENWGAEVALFEGEETNMKITNPFDLQIAQSILEYRIHS